MGFTSIIGVQIYSFPFVRTCVLPSHFFSLTNKNVLGHNKDFNSLFSLKLMLDLKKCQGIMSDHSMAIDGHD